jgi:hypothetical protein
MCLYAVNAAMRWAWLAIELPETIAANESCARIRTFSASDRLPREDAHERNA